MNLPIDITSQDPRTFSFTDQELGLTPVTTNDAIRIPATFDISYYDWSWTHPYTHQELAGSPVSIWIGKDAHLNLLIPEDMGDTYRHEIRSLAFEDGRTNLVENVTVYEVPSRIDYDDPEYDVQYSAANDAYYAATAAYDEAYEAYEEAYEAYEAAYEEWQEGGEEGPEPVEPQREDYGCAEDDYPDSDDYNYCNYFDSWDRSTRQYVYTKKTISDATNSFQMVHWTQWQNDTLITKSLRLPEGVVNFGQFSFMHSYSDYGNDGYFHTPTDFRIFIPSTVTHFSIIGEGYSGYHTFNPDLGDDPSINVLWFGGAGGISDGYLWNGKTSNTHYPNNDEEVAQWLENTPHDTVHIYLRNHQTIPVIHFYGSIYFPIVFHINGAVEDRFRREYEGVVRYAAVDSQGSYSETYDYDPVTIVADSGIFEITNDTALSETKFASVALSGSYNDLADKPAAATAIADGETGFVTGDQVYDYVRSLEARIADLEEQMTVNNSTESNINDFNEIEPEDSSDYVITDYESEE